MDGFEKRLDEVKPDLVVMNFGNNDSDRTEMELAVGRALELSRARGFRAILIQEANSGEFPSKDYLADRDEILRKLGAKAGVPVLPLDQHLRDPKLLSSGNLWWDSVHMTSYGNELAADWLGPQILKALGP